MGTPGLSQSDLERIICANANSMAARARTSSRDKTELLAGNVQQALRDVAKAIAQNNQRIAEQLEKAGVKIT